MNPCLAGFRQFLEILAEPSAAAQPRQGALHYPPARQYLEAMAVWIAPHHAQYPSPSSPSPLHQSARIGGIGPDQLELGEAAQQLAQHQLGAVPVLDVGRMYHYGQEQAGRIHYDVAFAPRYLLACACLRLPALACACLRLPALACACLRLPALACACLRLPALACVVAPRPPFRGLHRLAVNDGSAGGSIPSFPLSDLAPQRLLNPLPGAIGPPLMDIPPWYWFRNRTRRAASLIDPPGMSDKRKQPGPLPRKTRQRPGVLQFCESQTNNKNAR